MESESGWPPAESLTQLLTASASGDAKAREGLWALVYHELRQMAHAQMAREPAGRTLQPTALVNEVYLKLIGGGNGGFENRRHFFGAAARAMQQFRVDDARRHGRIKRGGGRHDSPNFGADALEAAPAVSGFFEQNPEEVISLDEAMRGLGEAHPELAEVVRLRYFAGMSEQETAQALGIAVRTVGNRWRLAKAWLFDKLGGDSP